MIDAVNRPAHYTAGEVEFIDALAAMLPPAEFRGFLRGAALKYQWRLGLKANDEEEDIAKAQWYLARLRRVTPTNEQTA